MNRSLIYFEQDNSQSALEMLEVAAQIYRDREYETYAVCFNSCDKAVDGKFDYIIVVEDAKINAYDIMNITNSIEELYCTYDFDSILIPATCFGRMLAPMLAMRLKTGLVADVTSISNENGSVEMVRPAFSGKLLAAIINKNAKPIMMSVRPNVFSAPSGLARKTKNRQLQAIDYKTEQDKALGSEGKGTGKKDIRESEVLVSGGGGVIDNFEQLQSLADELGAMVSASRRIVDSGIANRSIQVGQSGKTVSPKLYIALGIYGSLQHIEGLKNVENIISVNTNKDAPICSISDVVVEGDAIEFIKKLIEKIKKNRIGEEML